MYSLGNAVFAQILGYPLDATLYNQGMFYLRDKGVKPWNATIDMAEKFYPDNDKAQKAIAYYLSEEAAKHIEKAKEEKEHYFSRFPLVKDLLGKVAEVCKARGYIKYWTGRRRHFANPKQEAYKAANSLIQGSSGEITKEKLVQVNALLKDYKSRLVNTVHDSLVCEIHMDELHLIEEIRSIMDNNPNFIVPITCDVEWGLNWKEMHKFTTLEDLRRELDGMGQEVS